MNAIGFFGLTGSDAEIRNLGLAENLAVNSGSSSSYVGGLVGYMGGSSITDSHTTGNVYGGSGNKDRVGGLVGHQGDGAITSSHATGDAYAGSGNVDYVGGLVGRQIGGKIYESHATGDAHGGEGNDDRVGGLVGHQRIGTITSSWASGAADGGVGNDDKVGGLLGFSKNSSIVDTRATGNVIGGVGNDDKVGGLLGFLAGGTVAASQATGNASSGTGVYQAIGGLVGFLDRGHIVASYAEGNASGIEGSLNSVGGLVGYQSHDSVIAASYATGNATNIGRIVGGLVGKLISGTIIASYATGDIRGYVTVVPRRNAERYFRGGIFGRLVGQLSGMGTLNNFNTYIYNSWGYGKIFISPDGYIDFVGIYQFPFEDYRRYLFFNNYVQTTMPADLTSPSSRSVSISAVPDNWDQATRYTLGAWDFGDSTQNPALKYADYDGDGIVFDCDKDNADTNVIIIPKCGTLIPGQRTTDGGSGSSGASRSYASPAPARHAWHQPLHTPAAAESTLVPACDQSGASGESACGNQEGEGAGTGAVRVTLTADAREISNLIATFDDATHGPATMRVNLASYELTGIFADPNLGNWNNFDGRPDSARVGAASVSTWQIGTLHDAQATGSIKIKGVVITGRYINFLMAGGGATLDGGRASVGVTLYMAGTETALATHSPSHCTDRYIKGDRHWAHINVNDIKSMVVDIQIHDRDATSNCGFIAFDHFYQSGASRGQQAATATRPIMR